MEPGTTSTNTAPSSSALHLADRLQNQVVSVAPPQSFFFDQKCYRRICKISSKCKIQETVSTLKENLGDQFMWFTTHPQFRHIFHMPTNKTNKLTAVWTLLLRTVKTRENECCWFIVNGVPVRYSIREHALLTGLSCHKLPTNLNEIGSLSFVKKYFTRPENIPISAVLQQLKSMKEASDDRLKMGVLYFLGSVFNSGKRCDVSIQTFLVRVVDDLSLCKTFPWGTFTFQECMSNIQIMLKHFSGRVLKTWTFPGFITPLEILAYESIPQLKKAFRENVDSENACPRMCKMKFLKTGENGYPLSKIYRVIGTEKDIESILLPELDEEHLLANIDENPIYDPAVISWNKVLTEDKKSIFWEDLYLKDQSNRVVEVVEVSPKPATRKKRKRTSVQEERIYREIDSLKRGVDKKFANLEQQLKALKSSGSGPQDDQDEDYEIRPPRVPSNTPNNSVGEDYENRRGNSMASSDPSRTLNIATGAHDENHLSDCITPIDHFRTPITETEADENREVNESQEEQREDVEVSIQQDNESQENLREGVAAVEQEESSEIFQQVTESREILPEEVEGVEQEQSPENIQQEETLPQLPLVETRPKRKREKSAYMKSPYTTLKTTAPAERRNGGRRRKAADTETTAPAENKKVGRPRKDAVTKTTAPAEVPDKVKTRKSPATCPNSPLRETQLVSQSHLQSSPRKYGAEAIKENQKCKLIDIGEKRRVVAEGRVHSTDPEQKVHSVRLGSNAARVWVDKVKEDDAPVWRPSDEIEYMKDALGSSIAWPIDKLVIF